ERAWPSVKLLAPGWGAPGLFCGAVFTALLLLRFALWSPLRIDVLTLGLPTVPVPSALAPWPELVSAVFGLPGVLVAALVGCGVVAAAPGVFALLRALLPVVPEDEPGVALVPVPTPFVVVVVPVLLFAVWACARPPATRLSATAAGRTYFIFRSCGVHAAPSPSRDERGPTGGERVGRTGVALPSPHRVFRSIW